MAQILPTAVIALVICVIGIASLAADEDEEQVRDQEVAGQYLTRYGMYPSWYIPSVAGAIKPAYYYFRVPSKVAVYSAGSKSQVYVAI